MKKILMLSMSLIVAIALAVPAIAARPEVPVGPMKMELTEKHVVFNHDTHTSVDCAKCHHEVNGAENYQKCSDAGCHDVLGAKDKSVHSYYRIAHDRKVENSCIACHVTVAKDNPDLRKPLTGCKDSSCHP